MDGGHKSIAVGLCGYGVVLQHALPPRCRCLRRLSGGRRDRRAARRRSQRRTASLRSGSCAHEYRRRDHGPRCAGGRLEHGVDAVAIAEGIGFCHSLWAALIEESFSANETWRITERVERLNALGFDIDEMSIVSTTGRWNRRWRSNRRSWMPVTTSVGSSASPVSDVAGEPGSTAAERPRRVPRA